MIPGSDALQLVFDPLSAVNGSARTPFPGNVIPAGRVNSIGRNMASYYPLPNVAADRYGALNFDASIGAYNRADQTT